MADPASRFHAMLRQTPAGGRRSSLVYLDRCLVVVVAPIARVSEQAALRLSYRLLRRAAPAGATLFALGVGRKADGLAALLVLASAFTVRLVVSVRESARSRVPRVDDAQSLSRRAPLRSSS